MKKPGKLEHLTEKQRELAGKVILENRFGTLNDIKTVAGLDVHFDVKGNTISSCVVMGFPDLRIIEKRVLREKPAKLLPYISGYLAFREVPSLVNVIKLCKHKADIFMCDGQGIAHPRRIGLASHLGVIIDRPTIGCAKSRLYGEHMDVPPGVKGAYQFLKDSGGDLLGLALRSRPLKNLVFVSPGHLIDIETAGDIVLSCCKKFRIPEPIRLAHNACLNEMKG